MLTYEHDGIFVFKGVMPHVHKNDKYIVLLFVAALTLLRLFVAGCDSPLTAKLPSLFRYLIAKYKVSPEKKVAKMSESMWWVRSTLQVPLVALAVVRVHAQGARGRLRAARQPGLGQVPHARPQGDLVGAAQRRFFAEDLGDVENKIASWPMLEISLETRILLLMCTGFWISCLIFINWETRRSDSTIMKFHHLTTTILLVLSYVYNFHRISLVGGPHAQLVILFHDVPDVLLYLTKVYSHVVDRSDVILGGLFATYGLSHFVSRFVLLARYLAYPLLANFDVFEYSGGTIHYLWDFPGGIICPLAIAILMVMNAYWLKLVIVLAKNILLKKNALEDTREADD